MFTTTYNVSWHNSCWLQLLCCLKLRNTWTPDSQICMLLADLWILRTINILVTWVYIPVVWNYCCLLLLIQCCICFLQRGCPYFSSTGLNGGWQWDIKQLVLWRFHLWTCMIHTHHFSQKQSLVTFQVSY